MLDSARVYLHANQYPTHIVEGGLEYLLASWDSVARSVAAGEVQFQDNYLNDVDGRHILAEMLPHLSPEQRQLAAARLAEADATIRPHLTPTRECLWGNANEQRHGYLRGAHWWYYHRPKVVDEGWRAF